MDPMRPFPGRVLFAVVALLGLVFDAGATSSLSFEGGGYWIDLEVGQADVPTLASIRFHRPGDPDGVILRSDVLAIDAFDPRRHVLVVRYAGRGNAPVEPFVLSVHEAEAVLDVDGRHIASSFDWSM